MNEILHANIFFVIASTATVCVFIIVAYLLYQVIKVIKVVRSILEKIELGSEVLSSDLANVRLFFSEGGFLGRMLKMFGVSKSMKTSRRKKKTTADADETITTI